MKKILFIFDSFAPSNEIAAMRSTMITKYFKKSGLFDITMLTPIRNHNLVDEFLLSEKQHADIFLNYKYNKRFWVVDVLFNLRRVFQKVNRKLLHKKEYSKQHSKKSLFIVSLEISFLFKSLLDKLKYHLDELSVSKIYKLISNNVDLNTYDYIMSSYGPFVPHLIANKIKVKHPNIHWIADFRDPVFQITSSYVLTKIHKSFAHKVCSIANTITVVSESVFDQLMFQEKKIYYHLTNGFDDDYLKKSNIKHNNKINDELGRLNIALTGTYYENTNLIQLLLIINELFEGNSVKPRDIRFYFFIDNSDMIQEHIKTFCPLLEFEINEFIPRHNLLTMIKNTFDVMVVLTYGFGSYIDSVPGKLYEYLGLKKNVIGIVNGNILNHEIQSIINKTQTGVTYNESNPNSIKTVRRYLLQLIDEKRHKRIVLVNNNVVNLNDYQYENIVSEFVKKIL